MGGPSPPEGGDLSGPSAHRAVPAAPSHRLGGDVRSQQHGCWPRTAAPPGGTTRRATSSAPSGYAGAVGEWRWRWFEVVSTDVRIARFTTRICRW